MRLEPRAAAAEAATEPTLLLLLLSAGGRGSDSCWLGSQGLGSSREYQRQGPSGEESGQGYGEGVPWSQSADEEEDRTTHVITRRRSHAFDTRVVSTRRRRKEEEEEHEVAFARGGLDGPAKSHALSRC